MENQKPKPRRGRPSRRATTTVTARLTGRCYLAWKALQLYGKSRKMTSSSLAKLATLVLATLHLSQDGCRAQVFAVPQTSLEGNERMPFLELLGLTKSSGPVPASSMLTLLKLENAVQNLSKGKVIVTVRFSDEWHDMWVELENALPALIPGRILQEAIIACAAVILAGTTSNFLPRIETVLIELPDGQVRNLAEFLGIDLSTP